MLREQLDKALKAGLKAKDSCTISTVRLILAAVKERDIAARGKSADEAHVDDNEIQTLLQTMVKQRRESIEIYYKAGRKDLADREASEIEVIKRFLPTQMDEDAIKVAVDAIIKETGASSLKEMGVVMATLRERHPGAMDFGKAGAMAKAALS